MPEWFKIAFETIPEISITTLVARQSLALLLGFGVALVYRLTVSRRPRNERSFAATLVLLTVLIGMVSSVIGDNMARAFSLVGALSIVRFRTVVEDTRDTAFVIFAVAVGMAIGAGYIAVALVGMGVVSLGAWLLRPRSIRSGDTEHTLRVRLGLGSAGAANIASALGADVVTAELVGVSTARQGSALEETYTIRMAPAASIAVLVARLNTIDGSKASRYSGLMSTTPGLDRSARHA